MIVTMLFTDDNAKTTGRIMSMTQCVAEHMVMLIPTIYKIHQNIDNLTPVSGTSHKLKSK